MPIGVDNAGAILFIRSVERISRSFRSLGGNNIARRAEDKRRRASFRRRRDMGRIKARQASSVSTAPALLMAPWPASAPGRSAERRRRAGHAT